VAPPARGLVGRQKCMQVGRTASTGDLAQDEHPRANVTT
jgi:hypothetical protein